MRQAILTLYLMCGADGPAAGGSPVLELLLSLSFFAALGWKLARGEGSWEVAE